MRKPITITLLLLLGACSSSQATLESQKTILTNTKVVYPSLPNVDVPLPPPLKPVKLDYPRDISKPKVVKNITECKVEPVVDELCKEYPIVVNSNIFIGMDQQSFKNYIANQEQINGYSRSLVNRLDEVNAERTKWRESNKDK